MRIGKRRVRYSRKYKLKMAAIFALYPVMLLAIWTAIFGVGTVFMTADHIDNILHGKYGLSTESRVQHFMDNMDDSLLARFESDGGSIVLTKTPYINKDVDDKTAAKEDAGMKTEKNNKRVVGTYTYQEQLIKIADKADNKTPYHEFGHYVDRTLGEAYLGHRFSESESFCFIAESEIRDFNKQMHFYNLNNYSLESYEEKGEFVEYFADSFAFYLMSPRYLKQVAPATYAYMDTLYHEIVMF